MNNRQIRAVAVCRCSTEEESQKEALAQQVREAKQCIQEMGWQLVDTYVEAKSGTTVKGRKEYGRLLGDLSTDKFDVIVIKSLDRLMRNTKDWYLFLDKMQQNRKQLYIYIEKKFYTPDDSLITGIKAILAEEYSRELSKKINNAHRHRQKDGDHFIITQATYGYRNVNKKTVVNTDDIPLIQRIFELAAQGYGSYLIAKILYNEGYRNRKGSMITASVICNIIRNPIYTGDIIVNKKRYDFETKRYYNNPETEWIVRKNVVEPIISRELYEIANAAVDARVLKASGQKIKQSEYVRYPLSGKLVCGLCGKPFSRCTRKKTDPETGDIRFAEWKCSTYIQKGRTQDFRKYKRKVKFQRSDGCDNINLYEKELYETLEQFSAEQYQDIDENKIVKIVSELLQAVMETGSTAAKEAEVEKTINKLKTQKKVLLDKLLDSIITDEDYKEKANSIQSQITLKEMELTKIKEKTESLADTKQRVEKIKQSIKRSIIGKAEVNDLLKCVDKIVVYPENLQIHIDQYALMGIEEDTALQELAGEREVIKTISSQGLQNGAGVKISAEKEKIVKEMSDNPKITAKQIAQKNGWPLSRVNRRIIELREDGRIKYSTPNGKGHWIVLK